METQVGTPVDELSGRKLDAAVAEEVMGRKPWSVPVTSEKLRRGIGRIGVTSREADAYDDKWVSCPNYSEDIAAAEIVMVTIGDRDTGWELTTPRGELREAVARIITDGYRPFQTTIVEGRSEAGLEEAICRAALRYVRERGNKTDETC